MVYKLTFAYVITIPKHDGCLHTLLQHLLVGESLVFVYNVHLILMLLANRNPEYLDQINNQLQVEEA